MTRDYFGDAFGTFQPNTDKNAAIKFSLDNVLSGGRWRDLASLLTPGSAIGGVEGVPGWLLERRDEGEPDSGYPGWPPFARFRAYVDPEEYTLAFPEAFYDVDTFLGYVRKALRAFATHNPDQKHHAEGILDLLSPGTTAAA
jgi:hypothetical protein